MPAPSLVGLPGDVRTDTLSRSLYSTAACMYQITPQAVCLPRTEEEVRSVVRFAAEHGIPLTARGGGSSLVGQAVGGGIILDFSRYANAVLRVDAERGLVRTQPGITHTLLNTRLAEEGFFFPPDPSSGDYATIGGMIACNSSGAHSVKYGSTIDYVVALRCVLADGALVEIRGAEIEHLDGPTERVGHIRQRLPALLEANRSVVARSFPKVPKNSSGYRLDAVLADGEPNVAKLLVASEGTLAIVTEAELRILPKPKTWSMVLLNFDRLERAGEAVHHLLPLGPSALEIVDRTALDLIRTTRPDLAPHLPEGLAAQLFVEFDGDSSDETEGLCRRAVEAVNSLAVSHAFAFDRDTQTALMGVRKATLPILYTKPGPKRASAFVEDVIVPPARLGEFITELDGIFKRHSTEAAIYGHAGQGNLHVRPMLNLKESSEVEKMKRLAEEVFRLVASYGGSMSGEHGDGRARTAYLRMMYGDAADLFAQIKDLFDPSNLLNPGIKVPERAQRIDENLRLGERFSFLPTPTMLAFPDGEFHEIIERCHGCGQCRTQTTLVAMCPVFKVTGEEKATPRAKANLLRLLMSGQLPGEVATSPAWKDVLDTCIGCRMCSFECPSQVDIGRTMMEAKARYAENVGRTRAEVALGMSDLLSKLGAATAGVANLTTPLRPVRWLTQAAVGTDARRSLPRFAAERFSAWHTRQPGEDGAERKVVYFADQWAEYHDPDVGKALAAILKRHGVELILPPQEPCGIAALANGDLKRARKLAERNLKELRPLAEAGYPILCTEPTAALFLRDEYRDLLGHDEAAPVSRLVMDASAYVERLLAAGEKPEFRRVEAHVGYHAPCHLKALRIGRPSVRLLSRIPGVKVTEIDEGCCGMAGTYGMKKANYERSMGIGAGLIRALRAEEIAYGVTECSTCKMQMEHGAGKPAVHPLKLVAYAYGEEIALA